MLAARKKFEKEKSHPEGDGGIGEIKNRPDPEIEEIDDGPHADPVHPVTEGPAQDKTDPPLTVPLESLGTQPENDQEGNAQGNHNK